MSHFFSQKKPIRYIREIAKKEGLPVSVVEAVIRSQFEVAREGTETKLNTRFPYLFLLYHRENKNPEYLKHRKNLKNE